jgi:hypothetical protein
MYVCITQTRVRVTQSHALTQKHVYLTRPYARATQPHVHATRLYPHATNPYLWITQIESRHHQIRTVPL